MVRLSEESHKAALERLAELRKPIPSRMRGALKDAEDQADLSELELGARRKDLLAATSYRDAVVAHGEESVHLGGSGHQVQAVG